MPEAPTSGHRGRNKLGCRPGRWSCDPFNRACINLRSDRPLKQCHRNNQPGLSFLPHKVPFQTAQSAILHADEVATIEKRVWFHTDTVLDYAPHCLNFFFRNSCKLPRRSHHAVNSGCGEDGEPAVKVAAKEDVAGEKGQFHHFRPVAPLANFRVKREKHLKSFIGKRTGNQLLVLVTSVYRVPHCTYG